MLATDGPGQCFARCIQKVDAALDGFKQATKVLLFGVEQGALVHAAIPLFDVSSTALLRAMVSNGLAF